MKNAILACLAAVLPSLHAGELVPNQVPTEAKWQVHLDLDAFRASETGKAVLGHIESQHGAGLRAFKRMFSVHPLTDLRGITLYGDGKPDHAVALIDGEFNREHLLDIVRAGENHSTTQHAGIPVENWSDKGVFQHAAFPGEQLLVFSRQEELLELALDTIRQPSTSQPDPFFDPAGGRLLFSAKARISGIELPDDAARLLRMADTLRLAATERDGRFALQLGVEAVDGDSADRLRRILDGVVAFGQACEPKLSGLDLQAELNTTGESFNAAISLPVSEWITLMQRVVTEVEAAKQAQ
ncbi:hypothetical protein [Luteolibacter marinus]|uniref:hypothetical protein n=1 Tax=Luteolibacter marinus TaxID=2776705 RepID=UPI00186612B8|nr:hypothetical protein [Luteolibacter marinus]